MLDTNFVVRPQDHTIYTNLQGLNDLKRQAREDEASVLRPVAEQFEALFLEQILKNSRQVKFDEGWLDGNQADTYFDMYDKQLAQDLASKGSLGLADIIVEQLSSKYPTIKPEDYDQWRLEQQKRSTDKPLDTQQALLNRPLLSQ
ncbi:rod-binding protein [Thiomicrospira microaerophila]|uniref:rod-binding protein n=1 Tax=Thiomicrospira microaerophila TaxID=406020 RepID=UPI00200D0241|nr:rod-binding protein [Thiomicrospira microaerophila]UQB42698.1 rod-binding protein [Thiomicrospira microaerophila]